MNFKLKCMKLYVLRIDYISDPIDFTDIRHILACHILILSHYPDLAMTLMSTCMVSHFEH